MQRLARGGRAIVAHRDRGLRERVACLMRRDGFEVAEADDGYAVVTQLARWTLSDGRSADVVLIGPRLAGWSGLDLAAELPRTDWAPAVMLLMDAEEAGQDDVAELERRAGTPFVFRVPFEDEDLRTVALFLLRCARKQRPKEPRMSDETRPIRHRRRVELELSVHDAEPFEEIFEYADERVLQLEPHVVGAATCRVTIARSKRIRGAYEAHVKVSGPEQLIAVRRRSHTAMGALRHAFGELQMRLRRPRSGVEMRTVDPSAAGRNATREDEDAAG